MHTEQWGAGRAVLLPGITSSAATMWEIGEGLAAAGWTSVAVDLPGHGGTGAAGSYRFADVAELIAAQLGGGWDLVVGHSLGGAIATVLLAAHPSFARRALLVDPAMAVPDEVADGLAPELRRDREEQTEATVAAAQPHWHPRTVAERVRSTHSTDVAAVVGFATQNRPWDVRARAAAVTAPVHVLVPGDDPMVTAADLPPHWTVEAVPGTSHSLHRDRPALVVDRATRAPGEPLHDLSVMLR